MRKLLALFFATLQILAAGGYVMKWEMQYRYRKTWTVLPPIAPIYEIAIAGLFFFGGLSILYYILKVKDYNHE